MAVKVECDGCDKDLGHDVNQHRVKVTIDTEGSSLPQFYDLCSGCREHLRQLANPRTWPRAVLERDYPKKP